jgi:hypothetical protein
VRDLGVPYLLAMDKGGNHTTFDDTSWKTLPTYKTVKEEAVKKIQANF